MSVGENLDRPEIARGSDRAFGNVFAVVFAIIALYPLAFGNPVRIWALVAASVFALVAWLVPRWLAPLNRVWHRFGMLLHAVVNPIVLGIMFYLVVFPTGLIMRARGKDLLRLRFDRNAKSYWIDRESPGPNVDSFRDQF